MLAPEHNAAMISTSIMTSDVSLSTCFAMACGNARYCAMDSGARFTATVVTCGMAGWEIVAFLEIGWPQRRRRGSNRGFRGRPLCHLPLVQAQYAVHKPG